MTDTVWHFCLARKAHNGTGPASPFRVCAACIYFPNRSSLPRAISPHLPPHLLYYADVAASPENDARMEHMRWMERGVHLPVPVSEPRKSADRAYIVLR